MKTRCWCVVMWMMAVACGDSYVAPPPPPDGGLEITQRVDFEATAVGSQLAKTMLVTNRSETPLRLLDIHLDAQTSLPDELQTGSPWRSEATLLKDETLTLQVVWLPADEVADTGRVVMTTNREDVPTLIIPLNAGGAVDPVDPVDPVEPGMPAVTLSPSSVVFTAAQRNLESAQLIEIKSASDVAVNLSAVVLEGSQADQFRVSFPDPSALSNPAQDAQSFTPQEVAPQEVVWARVSALPGQTRVTARLRVDSDAPVRRVNLEALAPQIVEPETPCLEVSGPTMTQPGVWAVDFGEVSSGAAVTRTMQLTNCSPTTPLNISDLTFNAPMPPFSMSASPALNNGAHTLAPGASLTLTMGFAPTQVGTSQGTLTWSTDDPNASFNSALLTGTRSAESGCVNPSPMTVEGRVANQSFASGPISANVSQVVTLRASGSGPFPFPPPLYEWSVVTRPQGSTLSLAQNTAQEVSVVPDRVGAYVIEVTEISLEGTCARGRITLNVVATPVMGDFVRLELTWVTPSVTADPENNGTDLDLHYLREGAQWNTSPGDCYWQNPNTEWGAPGVSDDPSLTLDDTNGLGPEQIEHPNPAAGTYKVGVYYYDDKGKGESLATVRIFINGTLRLERVNKALANETLFWEVASITWPSRFVGVIDTVRAGF